MKHTSIYILAAAALIGFSSCDAINDKLDKYPLDTVSPGSYFMDATQFQTYLNTCYPAVFAQNTYDAENDLYFKKTLGSLQRGGTMRRVPSSGGGWDFSGLRHINTLFTYIDNCQDAADKTEYTALARFFRGYWYFLKVRDFGDMPWIDKELFSDDDALYAPRDSRETVMDNVIEDLDYAIEHLSGTVSSSYRVNKWTVLALKSRICLFEGTWRKYHANDDYATSGKHDSAYYLRLSAEAAKEFIDNSPYKLYETGNPELDYRQLFAFQTANPDEIILARNYSLTVSMSHFASWSTCEQNSFAINKKLVDCYLMKDGSRFTDKAGWNTMEFYDEMQDRDPRLAQTMRTPGYKRFDSELVRVPQLSSSLSGYQSVKYDQGVSYCPDTWTATDADLPILRVAEVLLNYAEAKAECGELTQEDLNISINKLRERVGMPALDLAEANANPDDNYLGNPTYGYRNVNGDNRGVILEIRRERMVELAQEGDFRWYDLMRWKEGKCLEQPYLGMYFPGLGEYDFDKDGSIDLCIYEGSKPETTALESYKLGSEVYLSNGTSGNLNYIEAKKISHVFNEGRDYLYPIPTGEMALNNALEQNPGWTTIKK